MTTNDVSIRKRLWHSVEMAFVRLEMILWAVGYGVGLVMCLFNDTGIPQITWMLVIFVSAIFLPFLGFWLVRGWRIFQSPGEYILCTAKLSQPHAGYPRGTMYFTVVLETEEEGTFVTNTHAIFQTHGSVGPLLEDYINKTVTIGYNQETGMVVVIR